MPRTLKESLSHVSNKRFTLQECALDSFFSTVLDLFALPSVGLGAIFVISMLAATILPVGSEPVFLGYLAVQPEFFWTAIAVATAGNSIGGFITYWMGAGAQRAYQRWQRPPPQASALSELERTSQVGGGIRTVGSVAQESAQQTRAQAWLQRFGAPALLLSWLPVIGDPLCGVAGWLRLPWLPCLLYMILGKFARYLVLGGALSLWLY